jgi:hypothetical protein
MIINQTDQHKANAAKRGGDKVGRPLKEFALACTGLPAMPEKSVDAEPAEPTIGSVWRRTECAGCTDPDCGVHSIFKENAAFARVRDDGMPAKRRRGSYTGE